MAKDKIPRRGLDTPKAGKTRKQPARASPKRTRAKGAEVMAEAMGEPAVTPKPTTPDAVPLGGTPLIPPLPASSKCVYFANGQVLARLEQIAHNYPRGSVSNIVSQLAAGFVEAYEKTQGVRNITVQVEIFI